jgi:signal transduction histidine kinase/PAS domain-containing protein
MILDGWAEARFHPMDNLPAPVPSAGLPGADPMPHGVARDSAGSSARANGSTSLEETLRSENRLRRILDTIDVSVWEEDFSGIAGALRELRAAGMTDIRGYLRENPGFTSRMAGLVRVLWVNDATVRMFGARSRSELMPSLENVFVPETLDVFAEEIVAIFEGRAHLAMDAPMQTLSGEPLHVAFSIAFPRDDSDLRSVLVTLTDVTARTRADQRRQFLAEASRVMSESLDFETTLSNVARMAVPVLADWCSVTVAGPAGGIHHIAVQHADPGRVAWAREYLRKYPPNPHAPHGAARVIRTGQSELIEQVSDEMLAASCQTDEQYQALRKLGLRTIMTVPIVSRGRVLGSLSFVKAESRARYTAADLEMAEELGRRAGAAIDNATLLADAQRARAEAERANRAKADFLANMSHELRTPLNAIGGYVDLLTLGVRGALAPDQQRDLERIRSNQQYLLGLINDILQFAKLEAGRIELNLQELSLNDVTDLLDPGIRPQMTARQLEYRCQRDDRPVRVLADRDRLLQILFNLLSNAVKFTHPGGSVLVSWERRGEHVAIEVADTGVGIPENRLESVFDPFVQVERRLNRPMDGVGLGLSISRDLARAMGGDLTVSSSPGQGAVFTLALPAALER